MEPTFGYLLTYDLGYGGLNNPWLEAVSAFQKYALAPYAAERMRNFEYLQVQVSQSSFKNFIIICQLLGPETNLTITLLPGWQITDTIEVKACIRSGQAVGPIPASIVADKLTFTYKNQLAGQPISYYKIFKSPLIFLPVILK